MTKYFAGILILVISCGMAKPGKAAEGGKEGERLQKAATVINEIMKTPETGIPTDLLNKAVCVGVIPSQKKIALGIGASYGGGGLVCRRGGNDAWGGPSMFTVGGASVGFQLGGQSTDFVLLIMNPGGAKKLLQSKTKLGADASVAGGPVGRTAEGATDLQLHAEILTYSRSKGLFAGVSLEGQVLKQDNDTNARLYGRSIDPKEILFGSGVSAPAAAHDLDAALTKYSPRGGARFTGK